MAQKFLTNLDLNQNQLINATFEKLGTDPSSGNFEGRMYFELATGRGAGAGAGAGVTSAPLSI